MTILFIAAWIVSVLVAGLYQNRKYRSKLTTFRENIKRLQEESTILVEEWTHLHTKLVKSKEDIEWVVNSFGELGIHIIPIDRYFFRYKESTLEYTSDDGPRFVRPVKKREFGETNGESLPDGWQFDINDPSVRQLHPRNT